MKYEFSRRSFLIHSNMAVFSGLLYKKHFLTAAISKTSAEKAPGQWSVNPGNLISGKEMQLELRYEHTGGDLPPGAYHRVLIEPLSVKSLFHCPPSTDMKLVEFKGALPAVKIEPQSVHGVGFREVRFAFPEGIKTGESFAVMLGNADQGGKITALINPVPVHNLTFEIYTGLDEKNASTAPEKSAYKEPWNAPQPGKEFDWQLKGWSDSLPKVNIEPAEATALRIFAPSLVRAGGQFDLRIAVTDNFDSRAYPVFTGKIFIENPQDFNLPDRTIDYAAKDRCSRIIKDISITKPGVYRLKARIENSDAVFESNPIVVREDVDKPIYWGNIHNHGQYSECWGDDLDTFYSFAREISGMDYVSLSDHLGCMPSRKGGAGRLLRWRLGHPVSPYESWKDTIETANRFISEIFVTLIGYEWSSMDMGHYNIYFADANMDNMDMIFTEKYADCGFELMEKLKKCDSLFIPHKHADVFPYRPLQEVKNSAGKPLTPCIEVYSDWGDAFYPYGEWPEHSLYGGLRNSDAHSYLWGLEKGYRLGVLSDSDSHTGLPGRRNPGGIAPHHDHPQGLTAAVTADFTRQGIMNAFHDRSTYGTTGERIFLDVKVNGLSFGQTLRSDDDFAVHVEAAGTDFIESVILYDGIHVVAKKKFKNQRDIKCSFEGLKPSQTLRPFTVTLVQQDQNRAYSSPVWVIMKSLPELSVEKNSQGRLAVVNNGYAPAENIEVMLSPTDLAFAAASIPGREPDWEQTAGFVWTTRRDDRNIIMHYRWHGPPVEGSIKIDGAMKYEFDYNRDFIFWQGKMKDHGNGMADFSIGKTHTNTHSIGFDIDVNIKHDRPCAVEIAFSRELTTFAGEKTLRADKIKINLNGITETGTTEITAIPRLEPGDSWVLPSEYQGGFVSIDPANRIQEINEANNGAGHGMRI
jgi:hypothetical protein